MSNFTKVSYKSFFRENEQLQKVLGFKNSNKLLENCNNKGFIEDKEIILEALFDTIIDDILPDFQIELLAKFLDNFCTDDLYHHLIIGFILYNYENDEQKKAIFLLSLYNVQFNTNQEALVFIKILVKLNLPDSVGILNSTKNLVHSLTYNKRNSTSYLRHLCWIHDLNDIIGRNMKSLNSNIRTFFKFFSRLHKYALKETEIEYYTLKYKFKPYELYLINFFSSESHLSINKRELIVSKFIISCFESENVIGEDFYELITKLYYTFDKFNRAKDGCFDIKQYFELYFSGFKNYENLPLAINLFNTILPSFYIVDIEDINLNNISDDDFLDIFVHKLEQNCVKETQKCINALNKRKGIDFISEIIILPTNDYELTYDILYSLIYNNFLNYMDIDYSKDAYIVRELLRNLFNSVSLFNFEIISFIYTKYGIDVFKNFVTKFNYLFFKSQDGHYLLPLEARKILFQIIYEFSYKHFKLKEFIDIIFEIFMIDIDEKEFLFNKTDWTALIDTLIEGGFLSSYEIDRANLKLLSPNELEDIKVEKEKINRNIKIQNLTIKIQKASELRDLYYKIWYTDSEVLCDSNVLKLLLNKIYTLIKSSDNLDLYILTELLTYLYNKQLIDSKEATNYIMTYFERNGEKNVNSK